MPVSTRTIARPFAAATATDRLTPMARAVMVPALSSSTCRLRIWTAGSALMMYQPMSMDTGTSSHTRQPTVSCAPRT